jgi:hypothetical protein
MASTSVVRMNAVEDVGGWIRGDGRSDSKMWEDVTGDARGGIRRGRRRVQRCGKMGLMMREE